MNEPTIVTLLHIYQNSSSFFFFYEITPKLSEKEKPTSLPIMRKILVSGLFIDFESATYIQISRYLRMTHPL